MMLEIYLILMQLKIVYQSFNIVNFNLNIVKLNGFVKFSLLVLIAFSFTTLKAQNKVGSHFGVVHGLVTFSGEGTGSIADGYSVGFPIGISIQHSDKCIFDLELVPLIDHNEKVSLVIHPGVLLPLKCGLTTGLRLAFEPGLSSNYGFTPLLNKGFKLECGSTIFIELVAPVRFAKEPNITLGIHLGVAF